VVYIRPQPTVVVQEQPTVYVEKSTVSSWHRLGRDWAKDLRDDVATREMFIQYLRENVTKASTSDFNEFRKGFISTYGVNAETSFNKAYEEARGN
jgi:hypothetical protein